MSKQAEYNYRRRKENPELYRTQIREYFRKYRKNFTSEDWRRQNANRAVNLAIKAGKLIRPDHCPKCGLVCKPDGHHHKGYLKEHELDVIWRCKRCHYKEKTCLKASTTAG